MGWQMILKMSEKRIWAGMKFNSGSEMFLYFNVALAAVSGCSEPSGTTSNMILLAEVTPSSALSLDCEYSVDESLSNTPALKEILKVR